MARNRLAHSDKGRATGRRGGWTSEPASLYAPTGERKYLNAAERRRALAAMEALPPDQALFALTLAWTGARISEVLALGASSFDLDGGKVAIRTLKRRRPMVREVPLPPDLLRALDRRFGLRGGRLDRGVLDAPLWPFSRITGWRLIKKVMTRCNIAGRRATARGFRHGFGVGAVEASIPITTLQRWMGHARLSTTGIYTQVSGPEERRLAQRLWRDSGMRIFVSEKARHASPPPDDLDPTPRPRAAAVARGTRPDAAAACHRPRHQLPADPEIRAWCQPHRRQHVAPGAGDAH